MSEHIVCLNPLRCSCECRVCMNAWQRLPEPSQPDLTHDEATALASDPIDVACNQLAALARAHGAGGFELDVRADGRVWIRRLDASGRPCGLAAADLVSGSSLPLPSAALAGMVRT